MAAVHYITVVNGTTVMPSNLKRPPPGLHRLLNYGRERGKVGWLLLWLLGA